MLNLKKQMCCETSTWIQSHRFRVTLNACPVGELWQEWGGVSAPYTLTKSVEYAREYRALPKPTKTAQSRLSSRHVGGNWIPGCLMHAHKNRQPHPQNLPPLGRPQRKEGGIAQVFQKHSASRFHAWIPPPQMLYLDGDHSPRLFSW